MNQTAFQPPTLEQLKARLQKPAKVVVTSGMPYANGPVHIGHLAGTHIPADIFARWMRMLIGSENVLFVCGSDDHGSTTELAAFQSGKSVESLLQDVHRSQETTLRRFNISLDIFSGTSRSESFEWHKEFCQDFLRKLHKNGLLEKRTTDQWFDPKLNRFLQDRFVRGKCPNAKCTNERAFSDECDTCGLQYEPTDLVDPKSALSDATPILKPTVHWWLDMWKVSETLRHWVQQKGKVWRQSISTEVLGTVLPSVKFDNIHEAAYKVLKERLPKHRSKYAAGKKVVVQCESKADLESARSALSVAGIPTEYVDGWARRSISRDVAWGVPLPVDLDPDMKGKTLYVWPDSLIAPLAFTKAALNKRGRNPDDWRNFWTSPDSRVCQFIGQDNVYFYTIMQGAMWIGTQSDINVLPKSGELQLTDVFSVFHLMVDGEKMSKSKGNFYTGDQFLDEKGFTADQTRYFLASLSLPEKPSNLDFQWFEERNKFLAGPMNAAFEKPISACHSKFGGMIPEGKLLEKVEQETTKIIQKYLHSMPKADYAVLLGAIENYARLINSLFTQFKPHDDRAPDEQRKDSLFSCFYILKQLTIMLHPFVPDTMDRVRTSLNLPITVYSADELGTPMAAGHRIGEMQDYFPPNKNHEENTL
jgi:methionyl-tRNA synthetase